MQYDNNSLPIATARAETGGNQTHSVLRQFKTIAMMSADVRAKTKNMRSLERRTALLAIVATSVGSIVAVSAEAAPIKIFPGDVYSDVPEVVGVVGDGTLGNDSWHVTTGSDKVDFFYLGDLLPIANPVVTIRDITRVSFDVKHGGAYMDPTFSMQIETKSPNHPDGSQAIDFFSNIRDDTSVDDSADFNPGQWNTYEWNKTGNAATGLEGTIHQNESNPGTGNGGNGKNNPWYTFKETLDKDSQYQGDSDATNDDYYSWLDEPIDGLKITARDVDGEFDGWIDNFTFTYGTGNGNQTTIVDFAAERVSVPEPATFGMLLFGLLLLGVGLGRRRYRA